jgi:hypothetical protein
MTHLRPFLRVAFAVTMLFADSVGCCQQPPEQPSLSDSQVRQFATKYRDEWLAKSKSDDTAVLARSAIVSVEKQPQGWHITFKTPTGHSQTKPDGIHDYYLQVYIKSSGEFDKIVRGPDSIS